MTLFFVIHQPFFSATVPFSAVISHLPESRAEANVACIRLGSARITLNTKISFQTTCGQVHRYRPELGHNELHRGGPGYCQA